MEENNDTELKNKKSGEKKSATKSKSTGATKKTATKTSQTGKKTTTQKKTTTTKSTATKKKTTSGTVKKAPSKVASTSKAADTSKKEEEKIVKKEVEKEVPLESKEEIKEQVKKEPEPKFEQVKEEKKRHPILKLILVLIIIVLVGFIVQFYRNHTIINKLLEKIKVLQNSTNYSYTSEYYTSNNEEEKSSIQYYYKDGKAMIVKGNSDDGANIIWSDTSTNEIIFLNPKNLTATVSKDSESASLFNSKPLGNIPCNNEVTRKLDFLYVITTDKIDGEECYKVNWLGQICWYSKESGLLLKTASLKDGKGYSSVTELKDWKIDQLTEQDVVRPNLTGYNTTESK